jgi:hypothetical protein
MIDTKNECMDILHIFLKKGMKPYVDSIYVFVIFFFIDLLKIWLISVILSGIYVL